MTTDIEAFIGQEGRDKAIQEVRKQIDAAGVEYMYYQFVSVTGRIMGKGIPAAHWENIANKGFQLVYGSTANLFVDREGNYIGYGPEARELVGIPDARDLLRPPLGQQDGARLLHAVPRPRGGGRRRRLPHLGLPRQPEAPSMRSSSRRPGSTCAPACEPEMMWLKVDAEGKPTGRGQDEAVLLPHRPVLGAPAADPQGHGVRRGRWAWT